MISTTSKQPAEHVVGMDTLRFLCAIVVLFGHCGKPPLFAGHDPSNLLAEQLNSAYHMFFSGAAAVIVFFLISGFCIHFAWTKAKQVSALRFVARRWIRIWIPLLASMAIAWGFSLRFSLYTESVLWSVYCEVIYYSIYPVLVFIAAKSSWWKITIAAYLLSLIVVVSNPSATIYPSFGLVLNWVVGLPCWLLGVCLAQWYMDRCQKKTLDRTVNALSSGKLRIWLLRFSVIFAVPVTVGLRFHGGIGLPWTLNLFAFLVYFWLKEELLHLEKRSFPAWLESGGAFSYSIYIVHMPIFHYLKANHSLSYGVVADFVGRTAIILGVSWLFYQAIERPSHRLARRISYRPKVTSSEPKALQAID